MPCKGYFGRRVQCGAGAPPTIFSPAPRVITRNPDLFWCLIARMWIGNLMLGILKLPLIGICVRLLRIPTGALSGVTVTVHKTIVSNDPHDELSSTRNMIASMH